MELTEKARQIFTDDRFATELTGIDITAVGEHNATCTLRLGPQHRNARGVVMGGVLFTLADFAAAIAANSACIESGDLHWVSLDSNIHYLAPASGEFLRATCQPLKLGRSTSLFQTIIESPDNGKNIAIVETTMIQV